MSPLSLQPWSARLRRCSRKTQVHATPPWPPTRSNAGWHASSLQPRLETLEDRIYPGDAVLGLWALALWGSSVGSFEGTSVRSNLDRNEQWHPGLFSSLDGPGSSAAILLLPASEGDASGGRSGGDRAARASNIGTTGGVDIAIFGDDSLARQVAVERLGSAVFPGSQLPGSLVGTPAGAGMAWPGVSGSLVAAALAGNGQDAGRSSATIAAASVSSSTASGPALSFNRSTGQLAIQAPSGGQTVQESVTAGGFVDVTVNGQHHSSNPSAASYDGALAGATASTVSGIRFQGSSADTLMLGSQQEPGGLMVQAGVATVVTQDIVTSGPLAIQAGNITVSSSLQSNSLTLVASGWVTIDATGRIDAPSRQTGSENPLSTITVAAGTFVNSGQLHADGPTGGQVLVQAGNILNAGPITADGTGPDGNGGQVQIVFTGSYIATTAAVVSASSVAGPGGQVLLDGGSASRLYSSGRQLATGSVGGTVTLLGRDIVLAGATVSTSGQTRGGSVQIGNDFMGANPAGAIADTVTLTSASTIQANALVSGSGGQVFIGANQSAAVDGSVSARGGPASGSGGSIDVSGQGNLSYGGMADAGAVGEKWYAAARSQEYHYQCGPSRCLPAV